MTWSEDPLAGRVLAGRYRVEAPVGRGAMGAVYRATDLVLERTVAVKVLGAPAGDGASAERMRVRFTREARLAARLHHPNVLSVYDFSTDAALGIDFLVTELLTGSDLAALLAHSGPPPAPVALRLLLHAARGLAAGHRAGLVHRDVKPANLFVCDAADGGEPVLKVLDFGIAQAAAGEQTRTQLTQVGHAPHTPSYASPEQLRGHGQLTAASDVFSLGATAFELLTGERAFGPEARGTQPRAEAIGPRLDAAVGAGRLSAVAAEVVLRALAAEPAQRFRDAEELALALEVVLGAAGAGARAEPPREHGETEPPPVAAPAVAPPHAPRRRPLRVSRRAAWSAVVVAAFVVVASGAVYGLNAYGWAVGQPAGRVHASCIDAHRSAERDGAAARWSYIGRICGRAAAAGALSADQKAEALRARAAAMIATGRHGHALQAAREAVHLHSNADGYLQVGRAYFHLGRHDESIWALREALRLDPASGLPRLHLARTLDATDQHERALAELHAAVRVDASVARLPAYQHQLGTTSFALGRRAESLAAYLRVTELQPEWPDAWGNLALAAHLSGRHVDAVAAYRRAMELDPNFFEARPDQYERWVASLAATR